MSIPRCLRLMLAWLMMAQAHAQTPLETWVAVERRAFDAKNFTQGLEIHDNQLWVSSGLYGESAVRRYRLDTLELLAEKRLPRALFAEGLTRVDNRLLLLTWRERQLLTLDPVSLEVLNTVAIPGEGWGITHHGDRVWYSDGSSVLYHFDASANEPELKPLPVRLDGRPVPNLNELEYIDGEIWANVWQTDQIVRIDPSTGTVNTVVDLRRLYPRAMRPRGADVMNGIARDPVTNQIWITGKRWPFMFAIAPEGTN